MRNLVVQATLLLTLIAPLNAANAASTEMNPAEFICQTSCQFWDEFRNECMYRTSCQMDGNTVTFTYCQDWDDFRRTCQNESVTRRNLQFPPWGGSPACTESCQHADVRGKCLYRTKCTLDEHCAQFVSCDRWDDFKSKCLSEMTELYCTL